MKGLVIFVFVGLSGLVYCKPSEEYTTKYDNVDIDAILKNDRLFSTYFKCVMSQGKCTKDGEVLKKSIPDAITNNCSKCSEFQRNGTKKVIEHLLKEKRPLWNQLQEKFDPENTFVVKYADDLKKAGITV